MSKGGCLELDGLLPEILKPKAAILALATFGCVVGNLSKAAIRPKLVADAGGFDQNYPYSGDWECWIRVAVDYGIHLHNEELVFVRSHPKQNSNLLNMENENIPQANKILEKLYKMVSYNDKDLLRRHWEINFFPPRLSRAIHQCLGGKFKLAKETLITLPNNILVRSIFINYIYWKFQFSQARRARRALLYRIIELNKN